MRMLPTRSNSQEKIFSDITAQKPEALVSLFKIYFYYIGIEDLVSNPLFLFALVARKLRAKLVSCLCQLCMSVRVSVE